MEINTGTSIEIYFYYPTSYSFLNPFQLDLHPFHYTAMALTKVTNTTKMPSIHGQSQLAFQLSWEVSPIKK